MDAVETTVIRNSRWRCDHGWDIDLDDGSSNPQRGGLGRRLEPQSLRFSSGLAKSMGASGRPRSSYGDPQFVDPVTGNFRDKPGSPAFGVSRVAVGVQIIMADPRGPLALRHGH